MCDRIAERMAILLSVALFQLSWVMSLRPHSRHTPSAEPEANCFSIGFHVPVLMLIDLVIRDLGVEYRKISVRVIISMMVSCNASVIIKYAGRRSGLPSAPLDMEYGNNSIEQ